MVFSFEMQQIFLRIFGFTAVYARHYVLYRCHNYTLVNGCKRHWYADFRWISDVTAYRNGELRGLPSFLPGVAPWWSARGSASTWSVLLWFLEQRNILSQIIWFDSPGSVLHMRDPFSIANETYSVPVRTSLTDLEGGFSGGVVPKKSPSHPPDCTET